MKKITQITSLVIALGVAATSTSAFAGVNNCRNYYPKVPYNCVMTKAQSIPSERAEFSAFETGEVNTATNTGTSTKSRLRSVPRGVARKLRAQNNEL